MRPSNLFFATMFLASLGVLILFAITTITPKEREKEVGKDAAIEAIAAPRVDFANPSRGAEHPLVTIVEYGDHRCEACAAMERDLDQLIAEYPGKIRVVWKDLPNDDAHPDALASAQAARCAGLQGGFWAYHGLLFANRNASGTENHTLLATQLGIDSASFRACVESGSTKPVILRDVEEAIALRVDATPYLFIGERRVSGAVGYDQLKTFVDAALAAAAPAP